MIVTAELGKADLAWLDELRRTYYPADRNHVSAHLTMFHALPPSAEAEARSTLARLTSERLPRSLIEGLIDLGGGVAFRVVSPDLDRIRNELAERFRGLLSMQDVGGWRPHVTIQNKVPPKEARSLIGRLEQDFRPRLLVIRGLGLHRYLGESWETLSTYAFRGR